VAAALVAKARRGCNHPPISGDEVKQLYVYYHSGFSWPVLEGISILLTAKRLCREKQLLKGNMINIKW
jgi:hypothetical protein